MIICIDIVSVHIMNYNTSRDGNGIDRSYVQPNSTIPQSKTSFINVAYLKE